MKKTIFLITILLFVVVAGFLIPYFFSPKLSLDYAVGAASAVEPLGILYPGIRYSDEKIENDRCVDYGLQQVLLQTYFWMFIPGPLIELCVYPDEPETVVSAGTIE